MSNLIKIAMVDDASRYSHYLIDAVLKQLEKTPLGQIIVYLPKSKLIGKPQSSQQFFSDSKKVWSSFLYPFQIFREAVADRISLVHIQLEVNTFGHPITLLLMPMLLLNFRIAKIRSLITLHSVFPRTLVLRNDNNLFTGGRESNLPFLALAPLFYQVVSKLSCGLVVHSEVFKGWLIDYDINAEKVHVIPHGVAVGSDNVDHVRINRWIEKTGNCRIILCFGVISPRKGLENLIRAYQIVRANHANVILVIAGYEPLYYRGYKRKLVSLSRELGVERNVLFTGSVSERDIDPLLTVSEIVVLPYVNSFSASGSLSIALEFAKPIVATDTLFFRNELKDGKNCLLVRRNDYVALSNAMLKLLESNVLRDQLHLGAEAAGQANSWLQVAGATVKLYRTFMNIDDKSSQYNS